MNGKNLQTGSMAPKRKGRMRSTARLLAVSLGLAATAVVAAPPNQSNVLKGLSAMPRLSKFSWMQIGRASWYGKRFQGQRTAAGEKFDMNALTCAHRTLPLGSWVRVTNLTNRKVAYVRVNDRGPVPQTRVIDLSYAAARKLGIGGTAKVRIEQVSPMDPLLVASMMSNDTPPLLPELPSLGAGRVTAVAQR
jgi:rare lipoprotein A